MMAQGNRGSRLPIDSDGEPIIENKKFATPMRTSHCRPILDDTPLKLIDILKADFLQKSRVELTPDPSGTVHHHRCGIGVARVFKLLSVFGKFTERLKRR